MAVDKLEKVRKLLAMAEAEDLTDAARESYNAKAAELIAQYGIDQALLAAHAPVESKPIDRMVACEAPYAKEKARLLYGVAEALRCKGILIPGSKGRFSVHVFGMAEDVERAELLFTSLLVQQAHGLATARPVNPRENVRAYRRSWMNGFRSEIVARLKATERSAQQQAEDIAPAGTSVALVLADRSTLVKAAYTTAYPKTVTLRHSYSGSGWRAGSAAGARADLGSRRVGGSGRRAVGR
ncbi:DUF2786 domain-containing protein [Parafrankia sp. EUN1f]|uniref:DUF2786 domain-containing protein n=1 Tax=Parafrankia sp. EUN1f TaxID=102897 RepID=UPI0001C46D1C|nr:DUF2786 domain-containing protein [Parafrankia sp. EUN1f]EFC80074.1 hypothetical protein FrEUN1fDRAFT_6801 [Parafrankia sp. EUN1f]